MGTTKQLTALRTPEAETGHHRLQTGESASRPESFRTSSTTALVSLLSRLDPAALGWTAAMSPDRPMPWISLREADGRAT